MPDVIVPVDWVGQSEDFFCGPAVAQMILAALGQAAPAGSSSWQEELWEQVKLETPATRPAGAGPGSAINPEFKHQLCEKCPADRLWHCWTTTPDALVRILNGNQAQAGYSITSCQDELDALSALVATIDHRTPAAALVHGWQHWIVVEGYVYHEAPNRSRILDSVYIRDPKNSQALVHAVTVPTFRSHYLKVVPCGDYRNDMVVLQGVHTKKGTKSTKKKIKVKKSAIEMGPGASVPIKTSQESSRTSARVLTPDAITPRVAPASAQLLGSPRWTTALSGATPQRAQLVQRLDREDSYYYIVGFEQGGNVTARLLFDAESGEFGEGVGVEEVGRSLRRFTDPALALARSAGQSARVSSGRTRVIRPELTGEHPVLVWRPCHESTSPFLPFYLRSIGDDFLYIRVDGRQFDRLTFGPA